MVLQNLPDIYFRRVVEIGIECAKCECNQRRRELSEHIADSLRDARQTLAGQPDQASDLLKNLIENTLKAAKLHVSELSVS